MPYHFLYNLDYGTAELTAVSNHTVQKKKLFLSYAMLFILSANAIWLGTIWLQHLQLKPCDLF